jgi:DNA-3-methyladenine glycosylase
MIDKRLNGEDLVNSNKLWIEDRGEVIPKKEIIKTTRVGVDYAGKSKHHPWRFYLKGSKFISRK